MIGYVARTDRYGDTRIIGRPSEINLLALKMGGENPEVEAEEVYDSFITARYGRDARFAVKEAFKNAFDIVTSTLYTLGTNVANHSRLNYDPYASSYARHVSGKWLDPPVVRIGHGVNREFHYWKDVIEHIAPPWAKRQAKVLQHDRGLVAPQFGDRASPVFGGKDVVALEAPFELAQEPRVVFNDE